MITEVHIKVIPDSEQRYPTAGDWYFEGTVLEIRVSDTGNWLYNMAIALHEFVEVLICTHRGITQKSVDEFDIEFEKEGKLGEPGDDPRAPYHKEHGFASSAERMLIAACDYNWKEYEETIL